MSTRAQGLERAFRRGLAELDVAARVESALRVVPRGEHATVVAIGKAAPAMAAGAFARLGASLDASLIVAPDGTDVGPASPLARLTLLRASHPLPDARSVRAGEACLAAARDARGLLVVLVSGGASALVCAPVEHVTLRTKRAITRAMLESGASVQDINVVRKHLSRIKGGGLVRAASRARVVTIVVSDVIGGSAADVGSGPSVPDASTVADARRLLRRFAPPFATVPLARTLAPSAATAKRTRAKVVLAPDDLPRAVARVLSDAGASVHVLPPSQAPAEQLAAEYAALAAGRPRVLVRAAEPAVVVKGRGGRGGRCAHVAALVARALGAHPGVRFARFAAFASDGVDGASGAGGAIVDSRFAARVSARLGAGALDRSIAAFDTGTLHRLMGSAVASRPSGHNLADLHVLVVE